MYLVNETCKAESERGRGGRRVVLQRRSSYSCEPVGNKVNSQRSEIYSIMLSIHLWFINMDEFQPCIPPVEMLDVLPVFTKIGAPGMWDFIFKDSE